LKTISNFLLILAGFSLPFLYANNTPIKKFVTESDNTKILQTKLESLDNEIKLVNEITNSTLENNNKILQDTKENLLRVGVCVDSLCSINSMEINCDTINSVVKDLR
jgi:hypothetical protein